MTATAASPLVFSEKEAKFDPNDSFWARELLQTNPSLQENIKVDIAVIEVDILVFQQLIILKNIILNLR